MDANLLVEDKFMKSNQFGRGDVPREPTVTITGVYSEEIGKGPKTAKWWLLTFKEPWAKPLKINRTHQRACIVMFGRDTDGWINKRLCLFALPGKFFGGEAMGGSDSAVRIAGSPDITTPLSFAVRGYGDTKTYDLRPMPERANGSAPPPAADPLSRIWRAWGDAGWAKDSAGFTALVKAVTGHSTKELTDADVEPVLDAIAAKRAETT